MSKRTLLAIVGALAIFGAGPAIHSRIGNDLDAAEAKINYYRNPGAPGWCEDPCDGEACCTTPGGGDAVE